MKKPLLEVVRVILIALIVYLFMRFLVPLALPFFIAALLARLLHPIVEKLHKKIRLKTGILSGAVLLVFLVIAGLVLWFVGKSLLSQLWNLAGNLPDYQDKLAVLWNDCCTQVEDWTGMKANTLSAKIQQLMPSVWSNMKGTLLPNLMSSSFSWAKGLFIITGILIIIGISTLLILKDYEGVKRTLTSGALGQSLQRLTRRVYRAGGGYVKAQFIIMIVVSITCVLGLFCTGNPYALAAGIGIGFCDALPFLGTGTIFVPWAILQLLQGKYMLAAVYVILYTISSLIRELLEPKLVGDKLGIKPLAVIISVYVGLMIYGLWGFALGPLSFILIREIWGELKNSRDGREEFTNSENP